MTRSAWRPRRLNPRASASPNGRRPRPQTQVVVVQQDDGGRGAGTRARQGRHLGMPGSSSPSEPSRPRLPGATNRRRAPTTRAWPPRRVVAAHQPAAPVGRPTRLRRRTRANPGRRRRRSSRSPPTAPRSARPSASTSARASPAPSRRRRAGAGDAVQRMLPAVDSPFLAPGAAPGDGAAHPALLRSRRTSSGAPPPGPRSLSPSRSPAASAVPKRRPGRLRSGSDSWTNVSRSAPASTGEHRDRTGVLDPGEIPRPAGRRRGRRSRRRRSRRSPPPSQVVAVLQAAATPRVDGRSWLRIRRASAWPGSLADDGSDHRPRRGRRRPQTRRPDDELGPIVPRWKPVLLGRRPRRLRRDLGEGERTERAGLRERRQGRRAEGADCRDHRPITSPKRAPARLS